MPFENAAQFDRALKKAIKESNGNSGETYRQMLRDRFLCRIFADPDERFLLKGGSSLLARIPHARTTKDIDFAMHTHESTVEVITALNSLVKKDLGDFCSFEMTGYVETPDDNGYSRLLRIRYSTHIGLEEKDPILIDLALDCLPTLPPVRITPLNRVDIEGLSVCDYLVYSLPDQLADKLCAIMEVHAGGWASSRMKDLVDVVFYAVNESISLLQLRCSITCECARRSMGVPKCFEAPSEWENTFTVYAENYSLPAEYATFEKACTLASCLFDPALNDKFEAPSALWNPQRCRWEEI